jgi:Zn-dependent peptidase ImmA (M78 family)
MSRWSYGNAFAAAIKVSKRLDSLHLGFPRKIETIIDYVNQNLDDMRGKHTPIKFHPRIYEASIFYGTIEDRGSEVDIYYDLNRNFCWKRFVCAKELCHLLYHVEDDLHLTSSVEAIDSLMSQILAGVIADQPATSEQAAIVMAIEVLLPYSERKSVNGMISKGGVMEIAKHYRLPAQMVPVYLSHTYTTLAEEATKALDYSPKE